MLSCPTCGPEVGLFSVLLAEPALQVDQCRRCGGMWIPAIGYGEWLERDREDGEAEQDVEVPEFELRDGPFLRRCPTCAYILGRYRVGPEVPFTIDRCHKCGGIWLDAHEWEVLKAKRLHQRLNMIFTQEWQEGLRRRQAAEEEDAYRRRILGSDGYERLLEFEDWVKGHPYRQLILELLADALAPKHPRHYQDAMKEPVDSKHGKGDSGGYVGRPEE